MRRARRARSSHEGRHADVALGRLPDRALLSLEGERCHRPIVSAAPGDAACEEARRMGEQASRHERAIAALARSIIPRLVSSQKTSRTAKMMRAVRMMHNAAPVPSHADAPRVHHAQAAQLFHSGARGFGQLLDVRVVRLLLALGNYREARPVQHRVPSAEEEQGRGAADRAEGVRRLAHLASGRLGLELPGVGPQERWERAVPLQIEACRASGRRRSAGRHWVHARAATQPTDTPRPGASPASPPGRFCAWSSRPHLAAGRAWRSGPRHPLACTAGSAW